MTDVNIICIAFKLNDNKFQTTSSKLSSSNRTAFELYDNLATDTAKVCDVVRRTAVCRDASGESKNLLETPDWVFITGGCSGRGVQRMGVVLYNKIAYNII